MKTHPYAADLAFVHDVGFTGLARTAAPGILTELKRRDITGGLVVDVGCGSGVLSEILLSAGYGVHGIDISPAMLRIARRRARGARFVVGSYADAAIPACEAIVAVGEILNYRGDAPTNGLEAFLRRAFQALKPGGVLLFDFLAPLAAGTRTGVGHASGESWSVLVTRTEDTKRRRLTRHIVTFRRVGRAYRRSVETHVVQLYERSKIEAALRRAGFRVRIGRGYGEQQFGPGHFVAVAVR